MQTEKDKKKAASAVKKAAQEFARKEKEALFQAKLVEQFNEKQQKANGAKTPQQKIKQWVQNPPYKCTDANL